MKNGKCPSGQYYCYTNKECKPIPAGFMVDPEGMLRKENGATVDEANKSGDNSLRDWFSKSKSCLLYTSPSPRDQRGSRMPSSA